MKMKAILQSCVVSAVLVSPAFSQTAPDIRGYWAGGYTDGQGGEIQFEMTVIEDVGELKYNATNWGALGFAICEYVFPVENGVPGKVTRNSGAGTGDCLAEPAFTVARPAPETLTLTFANPEVALDAVEMGGILRPFDSAQAHAPIAGLDILGIAPGMTFDQIDPLLTGKDSERKEDSDRVLEYQGFTIEQKAWGKGADEYDNPTDWVFVTFTSVQIVALALNGAPVTDSPLLSGARGSPSKADLQEVESWLRTLSLKRLVEMIELPRSKHPWFLACQAHPEFLSTPRDGHPLFVGFIRAAREHKAGGALLKEATA